MWAELLHRLPDFINGVFEFGIGIFQLQNLRVIREHREVRGIHWSISAWTTLWGFYNLYYYPHLGQWLSFSGGVIIFGANFIWLIHALHYEGIIKRPIWFVPEPFKKPTMFDPFHRTMA